MVSSFPQLIAGETMKHFHKTFFVFLCIFLQYQIRFDVESLETSTESSHLRLPPEASAHYRQLVCRWPDCNWNECDVMLQQHLIQLFAHTR